MPRSYIKRGSKLAAQKAYEQTLAGKASRRRYNRKHYAEIREIILRAKSKPCADCGVQYNPWVMQFDHRDPLQKKCNIGVMSGGFKTLLAEIAKCDVVCANCHAERTQRGQHWAVRRVREVPIENPQGELSL